MVEARVSPHLEFALELQPSAFFLNHFVGDAHIVGRPRDARGKIADFHRDLPRDPALDVPLQGVVAAGGECRIGQVDFILLVEDAELDRVIESLLLADTAFYKREDSFIIKLLGNYTHNSQRSTLSVRFVQRQHHLR